MIVKTTLLMALFFIVNSQFDSGQGTSYPLKKKSKPKITAYKSYKNSKHAISYLKDFDTLIPSNYYVYKYDGIFVRVRAFPNAISAQKAFEKFYRYFIKRPNFETYMRDYKHSLIWNYAGSYFILKGSAIYGFDKVCKHPESFYVRYESQMRYELYGKLAPDSVQLNFICGGGNATR